MMEMEVEQSPNLDRLLEVIRGSEHPWAIGNPNGILYVYTRRRLRAFSNQRMQRPMTTMPNADNFFANTRRQLSSVGFVIISVAPTARVQLWYCHHKLTVLVGGARLLLLGSVVISTHPSGEDYHHPVHPIQSGTHLRLEHRLFRVRISSHRHVVFVRNDDVYLKRITLEPVVTQFEDSEEAEDDPEEEETNESSERTEEEDGEETGDVPAEEDGLVRGLANLAKEPVMNAVPGQAQSRRRQRSL